MGRKRLMNITELEQKIEAYFTACDEINARAAEKEDKKDDECDPLLSQAIGIAVELGQVSISMLQRRMRIGYARAGRIVDDMTARGIIGAADGAKPRMVLISREEYKRLYEDAGE